MQLFFPQSRSSEGQSKCSLAATWRQQEKAMQGYCRKKHLAISFESQCALRAAFTGQSSSYAVAILKFSLYLLQL